MSTTLWAAFAVAYLVMAITPGPVTLLVMSYALTQGRRSALAVVAGTTLGDASCMATAMLGLGALLRASAAAFLVLKLLGAVYLVFLGVAMWRSPVAIATDAAGRSGTPAWRMFLHAYLTTVLNPKTVLFFMVFLPQFMDARASLLPQLGIFAATIVALGGAVDGGYSLFASALRRFMRRARAQRAVNRVAGGLLVGEGVLAAAWRGIVA